MATAPSAAPFSIPPDLLAEIQAEAREEQRHIDDVPRDAVKLHMRDQRWQRTMAKGQARAQALGFTKEDVPRLIADFRREQRQGH